MNNRENVRTVLIGYAMSLVSAFVDHNTTIALFFGFVSILLVYWDSRIGYWRGKIAGMQGAA